MATPAVIRTFLIVDMIGLALLALVYLWQRQMSMRAYCLWGLLAIAVPVLGPFLVIANRPGRWNPKFSIENDMQRLVDHLADLLRRFLPEEPWRARQPKKVTMAERVRRRRQARERRQKP